MRRQLLGPTMEPTAANEVLHSQRADADRQCAEDGGDLHHEHFHSTFRLRVMRSHAAFPDHRHLVRDARRVTACCERMLVVPDVKRASHGEPIDLRSSN